MIEILMSSGPNNHFTICTQGLVASGHPEISVCVDKSLLEEGKKLVAHITYYLINSGKQFSAGETMDYGYWLVKFVGVENGRRLDIWEYRADAVDFVRGARLTLQYWKDQHFICDLYQSPFLPPRPDKLTVISAGVLEGLKVQGIRYPLPEHMSGWWFTSDLYDGRTVSLRNEHTYHVTAARPDLAKYMALSEGFRFNLSLTEEVWFDREVIAS